MPNQFIRLPSFFFVQVIELKKVAKLPKKMSRHSGLKLTNDDGLGKVHWEDLANARERPL